MWKSFLEWLRFLSPGRIILIKKIIDAIESLILLLSELFDNKDEEKDKK